MNTKILTGMTGSSLERKINNFINDNQIEVIDIKFSSCVFYIGVMIIYK